MNQNNEPISNLDQDWLWYQKFQAGDSSAFNELFSKYKTVLINLAFRYVRGKEAAEDIAQEVLIKVYEKKAKRDPHSKFSTWLYRVTVNASLDLIRKKKYSFHSLDEAIEGEEGKRETLLEKIPDPGGSSPLKSLAEEEIRLLVQREVDRLPEKLRAVILLYQFEEIPYREIAKILGISEKAVERRLYHAKALLRERLSCFANHCLPYANN